MKCLSVKVTSTIVCYGHQYLRSLHRNYGLLKVLILFGFTILLIHSRGVDKGQYGVGKFKNFIECFL